MPPGPSPFPLSESHVAFKFHRWRLFFHSNGALKIRFFSIAFILTSLIAYGAFFSPHTPSWRFLNWHPPSRFGPDSVLDDPSPPSQSSSPISDFLTLEQIRDIVAPTRGFFSRDYSLNLGWNNVRYIIEAALLQAELLNRTLVIPSFVYARACEYNITVCSDYAPMVNMDDATGLDHWRIFPADQQMGFRIPISVIVNMTHLRNRQPVITASEYLRLHGQDPESESSSGFWPRQSYHTHPNVFETNKTKTPSLFVIENDWYEPRGTIRVDYIPEAMKRRGKLERHPGPNNYDGSTKYWPPLESTELSRDLVETLRWHNSAMAWYVAKYVVESSDLDGEVNFDDDGTVEELLNAHGFEVLHTFRNVLDADFAKTIVSRLKEVVQRSSIRGFRDDYHDVDADVVVLAGETHINTKPGAMRFTEELRRNRYASTVVHSLIPPQKVLDLAEVLSSRMHLRTEGRMWMGAHMRRGDFLRIGWVMEMNPEAHVRRVKDRLRTGRFLLADLHDHGHKALCDIEGAQPDPEQTALLPPRTEDPFFVATDERDPDALRKIAGSGAVFVSDLLTMEDRRAFGWPLMFTDVMGVIEQQVLVRGNFFYGPGLSSFAGSVVNMRAARCADPRTMILD
ncbi:hypothetical protein H4582DRAFT_1813373 [Lactarius indigo]|nr:hypothetical protein H4582DRAFT_1813373 [Lactarius indigo]